MGVGIGYGILCSLQDEQLSKASPRQIVDALLAAIAQAAAGFGWTNFSPQRMRGHVNLVAAVTATVPHRFLVAGRRYTVFDAVQDCEHMVFLAGQIVDFCHMGITLL